MSQTRLAIMAGISREHLNRIEAGKVTLTEDMQDKLMEAVEKFNPDAPMFLLFDYVRIRFPTLDIQHVIRDILKLNVEYMLHEDYGHYKYTEHYYLGDVFVYTSQDEEKGTLLELKGKGCRQFESYLLAQGRSWYDFLMDALIEGGVMKRLDLAINDRAGILDIPDLTAKCNREECVSLFRSFKSYASGELVKHNEQDKAGMGHTLYIGSLKSEVYFCCYEKNYEQYVYPKQSNLPCRYFLLNGYQCVCVAVSNHSKNLRRTIDYGMAYYCICYVWSYHSCGSCFLSIPTSQSCCN